MANTMTKFNSFISLGYVIMAESASKSESVESSPEETTVDNNVVVQNTEEQENILPINNQVLRTINLNTNYGSLRI